MKYKGLLFDLDGVIVDTAKYHYIAWKQITDELGVNFTLGDNERLKGVSRTDSFEIILEIGHMEMEKGLKKLYCERKNAIYIELINKMTEAEILPGVLDFIHDSKVKGYKIALGSASKNSQMILERLKLISQFDAIIDGMKVSKAKPDPEVFIKGAVALNLRPADCIVFEDSIAGVRAARIGGMRVVGIGDDDILGEADYVIKGFPHIDMNIIEQELL